MVASSSTSTMTTTESPVLNFRSVFWTKDAYRHVAREFYPCHSKQLNLILHVLGAGIQMWGAVQLLLHFRLQVIVYAFAAYVGLTVPFLTGLFHTALFGWFLSTPPPAIIPVVDNYYYSSGTRMIINPKIASCLLAFACGFLKDVGHRVCKEPPFIGNYAKERPYMFFFHVTWHLPFLIDAYSPFSTVNGLYNNQETTKKR